MVPRLLSRHLPAPVKRYLRDVQERGNHIRFALAQRRNHGICAVEIESINGFFAQLNWCLWIMAYCETMSKRPHILLTSPNYATAPRRSWLPNYFDPVSLTPADECRIDGKRLRYSHARHIRDLGISVVLGEQFTIQEAHHLFHRHLRIRDNILAYVDTFMNRYLGSGPVLGIHFRGTDKHFEAAPVTYAECVRAVCAHLEKHPDFATVFVASDEEAFIQYAIRALPGFRVIAHPDSQRSTDGLPIHNTNLSADRNRAKGFDALVNCLVLSRCAFLIRSASFLSGWASIFNPELQVQLLNVPHAHSLWFPDRAILLDPRTGRPEQFAA